MVELILPGGMEVRVPASERAALRTVLLGAARCCPGATSGELHVARLGRRVV